MTFEEYYHLFDGIAGGEKDSQPPYDNPVYANYTSLNWRRFNRWLSKGVLSATLVDVIKRIESPQKWVIILEPWCSDAAHSVPFIALLSRENHNISLSLELRDSEPFRINYFLTNGSKSIPKLIILDEDDNVLATWGPRPANAQALYADRMAQQIPFDELNSDMQYWYNANKGVDLQNELLSLFQSIE